MNGKTIKAYCVKDENAYEDGAFIIFAETRGKAIQYALHHTDGAFDWSEWTDMRALREKQLDKYYKGKPMMDWSDPEDRIAMVKDAGFSCSEDYDVIEDECQECPAHEWCSRWESMHDKD